MTIYVVALVRANTVTSEEANGQKDCLAFLPYLGSGFHMEPARVPGAQKLAHPRGGNAISNSLSEFQTSLSLLFLPAQIF